MILRTRRGNVELRSEWGNSSNIPAPGSGYASSAGVPVTTLTAFGLPAVSNVIRSPAEIIAALPFLVYSDGEIRERAPESWQWGLLHDYPSEDVDTFEFFYDLVLSLESTQNAYVQKVKSRGRVEELYVLDPQRVVVRRDKQTKEKRFDVWISPSDIRRDLGTDEILHVRGFTPAPGALCGVSLLEIHRDPLGSAIAMQRFEGDYFRNSGNSPFVFEMQQGNAVQARELLDSWKSQHSGSGKQWNPTAVWGGTTVKSMPLSMQDAAFADTKKLSIADACYIWRWPVEFFGLKDAASPVDANAWTGWFLKFFVLPRLRRIERAFAADPDLFRGSDLFGEFLPAALERADFVTRVRGYKDARQGSWITANEIRHMENLSPVDGGDEILITPTGSAPNPDNEPASNGMGDAERAREPLAN